MDPEDYGTPIWAGNGITFFQSGPVIIANLQQNPLNIGTIVVRPAVDKDEFIDFAQDPYSKQGLVACDETYFIAKLTPHDITVENNTAIYNALVQASLAVGYAPDSDPDTIRVANLAKGLDAEGQPQGTGVDFQIQPLNTMGLQWLQQKNETVIRGGLLGDDFNTSFYVLDTVKELFIAALDGRLLNGDFNQRFETMRNIGTPLQAIYQGRHTSSKKPVFNPTKRRHGHLRLIK